MSMTNPANQIEIITSVQRRRRWAAVGFEERVAQIETAVKNGRRVRTYMRAALYPAAELRRH